MALRKRAALRILPGQADRHAVLQNRGERQNFRVRPIDFAVLRKHAASPF